MQLPISNFISDLDVAIEYWKIVLSGRFKFLELWCQFLQVSDPNLHESFFQIEFLMICH